MPNKPQTPPPAEKHPASIWDNRVFSIVVSICFGLVSWLIVTMFIDQKGTHVIYDVPINFANNASTYTALGLDIVERPEDVKVRVLVEGNSTIIGNMEAADIMVYPSYASVKGPGEALLKLSARVVNTTEYGADIKLTVESPSSISVVFDEVSDKIVPVTVDTSALSVAEGYILNKTAPVPAEVTLTGPTSELEQIAAVVAPVQIEDRLSDSTTVPTTLQLRNENGDEVSLQYTTVDADSANVTLTVYQVRELPLSINFIGVPSNFDTGSLRYTLSQETLRVAGPARAIGAMENLSVSSFDLAREFEPDRDSQRLVELPAGIVSMDGVTTVTISFDTENLGSTTLNLSNIQAVNVPSNYDVDILSSVVNGVTLYGPKAEIEALTADSVQAVMDCQSVSLTAGQQTLPVTIRIPSSSRIFATGSYTVQCEVTPK